MRRSEVVPSEGELRREDEDLRLGLPPAQIRDYDAWAERMRAERKRAREDRQGVYDRTQR